jgi:uncharacterized protein YndB with AHSA1/START domain
MSNATSNKLTVEKHGERQIKAERVFNAPRDKVFTAMTDPDLIGKWWGPHGTTTLVEEMNVEPGGRWHYVSEGEGPEGEFSGIYRVVEAPERIEQTFEWGGMPGYISVDAMELEDQGAETRVLVTSTFHFAEERDGMIASGMEGGMAETYDRLEELLATS